MKRTPILIALTFLASAAALRAQEGGNAYTVTDPAGREVYMIPECIVEKTVSTTLSLPGEAKERALVAPVPGGFLVQVGAFARQGNVARVRHLLAENGYASRTSGAYFRSRNLAVTVVSAGLFRSGAEAEAASRAINRLCGVTSLVVPPDGASYAAR